MEGTFIISIFIYSHVLTAIDVTIYLRDCVQIVSNVLTAFRRFQAANFNFIKRLNNNRFKN